MELASAVAVAQAGYLRVRCLQGVIGVVFAERVVGSCIGRGWRTCPTVEGWAGIAAAVVVAVAFAARIVAAEACQSAAEPSAVAAAAAFVAVAYQFVVVPFVFARKDSELRLGRTSAYFAEMCWLEACSFAVAVVPALAVMLAVAHRKSHSAARRSPAEIGPLAVAAGKTVAKEPVAVAATPCQRDC